MEASRLLIVRLGRSLNHSHPAPFLPDMLLGSIQESAPDAPPLLFGSGCHPVNIPGAFRKGGLAIANIARDLSLQLGDQNKVAGPGIAKVAINDLFGYRYFLWLEFRGTPQYLHEQRLVFFGHPANFYVHYRSTPEPVV